MAKKRAKLRKSAQKKVEHKPNARHTLNEVLHSLQDLMHNELAEIVDNDAGNASTETTMPRSKEEVLKSLQALIGKSKNTTYPNDSTEIEPPLETMLDQAPDAPGESTTIDSHANVMNDSPNDGETMPTGVDIDIELASAEADGIEDNFSTLPPADEFELEMEELHESEPKVDKKSATKNTSKQPRDKTIKPIKHGKGEQVEINWDDIPVLNEVVAPPPVPGSSTTQEAREIAIKVAAMLNIEARKKGGETTLDVRTIMRLQSLLSQELHERQDDSNEADEEGTGSGANDATGNDDD